MNLSFILFFGCISKQIIDTYILPPRYLSIVEQVFFIT